MTERESDESAAKLSILYRDYDLIDARTRLDPRKPENQEFITGLLKDEPPSFYFFLNCELRIANIIDEVLSEERDELRNELERVIEDREDHRVLWDRMKAVRKELNRALHMPGQEGENTERLLLQGVRNAFEKRRDRVYELLKIILWEKRKNLHTKQEQQEIDRKFHLISVIQWFHRGRAFAQKAHHRVRQIRGTGEAYIFHPLRVASHLLLAGRSNLRNPRKEPDLRKLVWCGHNHDVVEDTPVAFEEVEDEAIIAYLQFEQFRNERVLIEKEARVFAKQIRTIIELDSEDDAMRALPKPIRERAVMQRLAKATPPTVRRCAFLLKLADRIDNIHTLEGMGDPGKIRRKLRSTVEWCRFVLNRHNVDYLGLAEYLTEETRFAYKDFQESHEDMLQRKDRENMKWLTADSEFILAGRKFKSFIPKLYETVLQSPDELRAATLMDLEFDIEDDEETLRARTRFLEDGSDILV